LENTKPGFFIIARPDLDLTINLVILDSKIKRLKKKRGTWFGKNEKLFQNSNHFKSVLKI